MQNVKVILAYDGTRYAGWQQTIHQLTVEETVKTILEKIYSHPIVLQAASRTDAGVHADGQVINFLTPIETHPPQLYAALSCLLPRDIIAQEVHLMPLTFHPTLDCKGKEYHYDLCYGRTQAPKERLYAWHYPHLLDLDKMREAASFLVGEHDFSAFCNLKVKNDYSHYLRHLKEIQLVSTGPTMIKFIVRGNNFLYRMVRNLVGTLVYTGVGKIKVADMTPILEKKDRRLIGPTAPAHGLTLHKVCY